MANDKHRNRDAPDVEQDEPLDTAKTTDDATAKDRPNPPRTTTGVWTSPKFGSAGSGGAELEPGPERD
ncbi:MAG: hypothetical protein ACJ79A_07755 [Gemmatimonadaceae bacterium]